MYGRLKAEVELKRWRDMARQFCDNKPGFPMQPEDLAEYILDLLKETDSLEELIQSNPIVVGPSSIVKCGPSHILPDLEFCSE